MFTIIQEIFSIVLITKIVEKNSNFVIFCDYTSSLEEINKIIDKHNPIIIAFDYESHNLLLENNIVHELSDDYLNNDDLDHIQDLSYKFSNWYNKSEISNLIEYEGINLGELFYLEFNYYLSPILKQFFEIQKISKKYLNYFFISSPHFVKILKLFSSNFDILENNYDHSPSISSQDISLKFGKFTFTTKSQNILTKNLIKLFYSLSRTLFLQKKINNKHPTILLVNFTTLRLKNFFNELPNHSLNLVKYDTTVPAFWNYSTFSLIKKSGCFIENNDTIPNNENSLILDLDDFISKKLQILLNNEQFFDTFFSLNDLSFWSIIKNDFLQMFVQNYKDSIQNILKIKSLFKKYSFSSIVLASECGPLDLLIIHLSKQFGIKTSILQHALYYDDTQNQNYYNFKSDQFQRVYPTYCDNFLVWGNLTQIDSKNHGVPGEKIISIGCPFFDPLIDDTNSLQIPEKKYVLLATTPKTLKNQTRESSIKFQIEYNDMIKKISQITTKINKNLLIKVHHGSISNEKKIVNKINSNIIVETTGSFYQYAKKCDVLICIDMSTAILEAMILKKPVILVLLNDEFSYPEIFKNDYLTITNISNLENVLIKLFSDDEYKKTLVKNGEKFLDYYLDSIGSSSKKFLDFLEHNK